MRVLFLIDNLLPGGKERQSVTLLKALAQTGVETFVVSMGTGQFFAESLRENGIRVRHLTRRGRWDPLIFVLLARLMRSFSPDVLHTTCWMTSFYGLPLAKLFGVPVVNGSIRNAFSTGGPRWHIERMLLKLSDARIANSLAGLVSRGFRPSARGNYVVHNGFDPSRLVARCHRGSHELLALARGRRIVGMVAQFRDDKDYATYLEAASRILEKRSDTLFVAIGDGKNLDKFRQMYEAGAGDIVFMGRQTAVESLVSAFDVGVLATYTEGISNALMEYMALGKPAVATSGGGTEELLIDGVTGFLVPPREPKAVVEKVELLLDSPQLAMAFGQAAKQRLNDHFSLHQLVNNTMACYGAVLKRPRAAATPVLPKYQ